MGGRTKRAIRSECDRFETDAEVLVLDGLVRAAVLGGSVAVGAGSTYLTRQGVYGRVDGGVVNANVQDGLFEDTAT